MTAGERKHPAREARDLDETVVALGRPDAPAPERRPLVRSPLLAALEAAGTAHVYVDTADVEALGELLPAGAGGLLREVDGNTANQPLVREVAGRYLDAADPAAWAEALRRRRPDLSDDELIPLLYSIVCGRIGNDVVRLFASGRAWEVSLQLHMGLARDPERARRVGRYLRRMVPSAFVKVPFTPHLPHSLLVARDLEREGIPVNFTSTFSARQAVAVALFAHVHRTNIFMGRLNQGLGAARLGEHVDLEAQRALLALRSQDRVKTRLIVASMRDWRTFPQVAGCDVFTAPPRVLAAFLEQREVQPEALRSQLHTSYEDRLGIPQPVRERLGDDRIARLYRVEPELVEFLRELAASGARDRIRDGDELFRRFDGAGYGDFFYAPTEAEWREIRRSKLPDLESPLTARLPLDTLFTLLAHGDFETHQAAIDREIMRRLGA